MEETGFSHCLEPVRGTSAARNDQKHYYKLGKEDAEKLLKKLALARNENEEHAIKAALNSMLWCGHDVGILREKRSGKLIFMEYRCDKKFCPVCGIEWSQRLRAGIKKSTNRMDLKQLRHVVLTVQNARKEELKSRIDSLYGTFREWRNQGRRTKGGGYWKDIQGLAWKLEIDKRKGCGFHPHLHVLVQKEGGLDLRKNSKGRIAWSRLAETYGTKASLASGIYITKINSENHEREIGKYAAKPLQIAGMNHEELLSIISSTYKKRFCGSSGNLQCSTGRTSGESAGFEMAGSLSLILTDHRKFKGDIEPAMIGLVRWLSFKEEMWGKIPLEIAKMAAQERAQRSGHNAEKLLESALKRKNNGSISVPREDQRSPEHGNNGKDAGR